MQKNLYFITINMYQVHQAECSVLIQCVVNCAVCTFSCRFFSPSSIFSLYIFISHFVWRQSNAMCVTDFCEMLQIKMMDGIECLFVARQKLLFLILELFLECSCLFLNLFLFTFVVGGGGSAVVSLFTCLCSAVAKNKILVGIKTVQTSKRKKNESGKIIIFFSA